MGLIARTVQTYRGISKPSKEPNTFYLEVYENGKWYRLFKFSPELNQILSPPAVISFLKNELTELEAVRVIGADGKLY